MTISTTLVPPSRGSAPATFSTDMDTFLSALPAWTTQANALETNVNAKESTTVAAAATASTDATTATTQAGIATTKAGDAQTYFLAAADNAISAGASATQASNSAIAAAASALVVSPVETQTHAAASKTTPVDADEIPLVDSTASFGLKKLTWSNLKATAKTYNDTLYAALGSGAVGFRNRIINGDMRIDQEHIGAAQTITAGAALAYTVDQWYAYCTGANVTGQQVAGANQTQKYYRFTGAASVTAIGFGTRLEARNTYDLNSQTVTIAADLANSLLTTVTWTLYRATTTDDTFGTLASPTVTSIATGTFTVNSTVTRYSTQVSVPAAATTGLQLVLSVGAQTSGTWTIANVQLELASTASSFEQRPFQTELSLCQRFYEKSYNYATAPATVTNGGALYYMAAGTEGALPIQFKATKRATPTMTYYSPVTGASGVWRNGGSLADVAASNGGIAGDSIMLASSSVGVAAGNAIYGHFTASARL